MSRKVKNIEATWSRGDSVTQKSRTEMGLGNVNVAGLREKGSDGRGRPSVYDSTTMPYQAFIMAAKHGASLKEMADLWGVTESTVAKWVDEHEDFSLAIREGRDQFNVTLVEKSLVKRALGYTYDEITTRQISFRIKEDGETKVLPASETLRVTKQIAPDVQAIMFYLKNRSTERWKDQSFISGHFTGLVAELRADLRGLPADALKTLKEALSSAKPIIPALPMPIEDTE